MGDTAVPDAGPPDLTAPDLDRPDSSVAGPDLLSWDTLAVDSHAVDHALPSDATIESGTADALGWDAASLDAGATDAAIPNYAFVTAATFTIGHQLLGPTTADELCSAAAAEAGLPDNTYVAWISDGTHQMDEVIENSQARGWIRTDGKAFADTFEELLAGVIYHPLNVDERGDTLSGYEMATTNTDDDGTFRTDAPCDGWANTGTGTVLSGMVHATRRDWTEFGYAPCDSGRHLYCLGIERAVAVEPRPQVGRVVFLSTGTFSPGTGHVAADILCQSEALAAGLQHPGDYKALLADVDQGAARDRFTDNGQPWVRPDGVVVADSFGDLFDTYVRSPLNTTAHAPDAGIVYVGPERVWTGASTLTWARPDAGLTLSCEHWSVGDAGATGIYGIANFSNARRYNSGYPPATCDEQYRVYCLEG